MEDVEAAARETVDYLYKIEGECPPELYKAIDRLRQLINEEFVGKDKTVSSQLIFDIVNPAITALIQEAEKRQLVWVRDNLKMDMKDWGEVNRRIKKLGGGDGKS